MLGALAQTPSAPEIEQIGSAFAVKVAAADVATPHGLLNCARNCLPLSLALVVNV